MLALFESAMVSKGKRFGKISKIIGSKSTKQCVEFYYFWKQSTHYEIWKSLGRKQNKKISHKQRKLHKKIGEKFQKFYGKQIEQVSETKNEIYIPNEIQCQYAQQQQPSQQVLGYYPQYAYSHANNGYANAQQQPVNGGNGGYSSWYPAATGSTSATAYAQYQQYAQQQPVIPTQPQLNMNSNNSNHNVEMVNANQKEMSTTPADSANGSKVIDLTEESPIKGSNIKQSNDMDEKSKESADK